MAAYKDTFEPNTFEANTFACGAWRGASAVVHRGLDYRLDDTRPHYWLDDTRPHYWLDDTRPHYVVKE